MAAKKVAARLSATLALAGGDDSVTVFISALTQTQAQATQLSANLSQMKSGLDQIIKVLTYPQTVSTDLDHLSSVLSTASTVLTAVSVIPEISAEVKVIQTAVNSLRAEITPAKNAADAINAQVTPLRNALSKLDSLLAKAIQVANDTASAAQTFLTSFQKIDTCIHSLPDGPPKTQGLQYLASFAATATPPVNNLNTALIAVNGTTTDFYNAINQIESQLNFLSEISNAIESVMSGLAPLLGPLQSLSNLLDTKITIPTPVPFYGVHVSIRDILSEFQAFTDLAMQILNPILGPILAPLQQLAQSIIGQIPGLSQLLNLHINVPSIPDFSTLFGNLSSLLTQLNGALQLFNLKCPPAQGQASFAVELVHHMNDVTGAFTNGALHTIHLGPDIHLTAAKGQIAASSAAVGRTSLFRAHLDLSKRVVLSQASSGKLLALQNGEPCLRKGPVTPESHFEVVATGDGKFSLKGPDGALVVDGKSEFTAARR